MNSISGFLLVILAGALNGTYALPMKRTRRWAFENTWLVYSIVGMVLSSWLAAFLTVPELPSVISRTEGSLLLLVFSIVPSFFWVSTVGAVVHAGPVPVLCEVDESFCMDPEDLKRKITPRTGLILPVRMAGAVSDMRAILAVAHKCGIPTLEDCAQANGGHYQGKKVGTFATVGIFSLQLNKNVTAGEGGLLVTNDAKLYKRAVSAHDLGIPREKANPK